ncbi:MAG: hypothetical protein B6U88_01180 [Candidatus Aenigmarchaeota archaeon ex4484_56]|nr:MAG: hypothetical protein B6U88_01180 [Candidatus Aenigmarchaeota archaeon ex4484_56]
MNFQLELTIIFSRELDDRFFNDLLKKIREFLGSIFLRGTYSANRVFIVMEGAGEASPLVLDFVNFLNEFCKGYKTGIRDFYLPYYELSFNFDYVGKIEIPFTEAVICNGELCKVVFKNLEKEYLKNKFADRVVRLIKLYNQKSGWKLLYESEYNVGEYFNPVEEMEKRNYIKRGIVKKEFFYLPKGANLITKLRKKIFSELKNHYCLKKIISPSYIPLRLLEDHTLVEYIPKDILKNFFVCKVDKKFEEYYLSCKLQNMKSECIGVLYSEIPLTFYKAFEGKKIKENELFYFHDRINTYIILNYKKENLNIFKDILETLKLKYRILINNLDIGELIRFEIYIANKWKNILEIHTSDITKNFKIKNNKISCIHINFENLLIGYLSQKNFTDKISQQI